MPGYSSNALQTVAQNNSVIFTTTEVPCNRGLVRHRDGTGSFLLSGYVPNTCNCGCRCNCSKSAEYLAYFGANIAIPTGGTVEEISLALAIDGTIIPSSTMIMTPAAVEQFYHVSCTEEVPIWKGCCESLSVINLSTQPILVQNAKIIISRPDLYLSR